MAAMRPVAAAPADTWHLLTAEPAGAGGHPVQAIASDPATASRVLYGTASGEVYRSNDGGTTFNRVATGLGRGVLTLAFDPIEPTHVLAGTREAGIWRSEDSGGTWHSLDHGTETVRGFSFSLGLSAAASETGVLVTTDGDNWTSAGLKDASVAAVAAGSGQVFAAADLDHAVTGLPLFHSGDGGSNWKQVAAPAAAGQIGAALALKSGQLLLGTSSGLFASGDGGATWTSLSSSGALPGTDYTAILPVGGRIYVASDGGSASTGGLWATDDGQSFRSLNAPVGSVTAVDVTSTTIYTATFRAADRGVQLWSYVDDGGPPHPADTPLSTPAPAHQAAAAKAAPLTSGWFAALAGGPEAPYLALGIGAVVILFLALIAYLRRGRG